MSAASTAVTCGYASSNDRTKSIVIFNSKTASKLASKQNKTKQAKKKKKKKKTAKRFQTYYRIKIRSDIIYIDYWKSNIQSLFVG